MPDLLNAEPERPYGHSGQCVSTGGMSDPWTVNNPVTPPFAANTARLMTTTKAADAMTILRRLIFAECDRRRPLVLPPIVILRSPDDQYWVRVLIATTSPMINRLIARPCPRGNRYRAW